MAGVSWDEALKNDYNRFYAMLSRRLSNWAYASTRIGRVPYSWIDNGPNLPWDAARPPADVAAQLAAFRRWANGAGLFNYVFCGINGFDYTSYVAGIQAASAGGSVDSSSPTVTFNNAIVNNTITTTSSTLTLSGSSTDNFAIKRMVWVNWRAGTGAMLPMTWTILSGNGQTPWVWRMDWSVTLTGLQPGNNVVSISATDIHGLTVDKVLTVVVTTGGSGADSDDGSTGRTETTSSSAPVR
jgi:hypothetical protein